MYNKLFTKILDSSIWLEPDATRIVWMTLIAAMDEDGFVQFASIANLAHRARVSLAAAKRAVASLEGPDENSSDPDHEGRRIERVAGGWIILNAGKYRELVSRVVSREQTRIRVARHREKRACNGDVTRSNESVTPSEAEVQAEAPPKPPAAPASPSLGGRKDLLPTSEPAMRIAVLFRRALTTRWSDKEIRAFKKAMPIALESLDLIERYYAVERAKGDEGIHRRDMLTFLNNFTGELDRANAVKAKTKRSLEWLAAEHATPPEVSDEARRVVVEGLRATRQQLNGGPA